jgi:hypothetical protein
MQTEKFIQLRIEETRQLINQAEKLKNLDLQTITWRESERSWSVLECLEHLNLYGNFYLPQIENKIRTSKTTFVPEFKSGILGSYFAKSMLPKEKPNKMKTFKDKNPLYKSVIDQFIIQQLQLLELLNLSANVNLNKVKIPTSITSLIQLKLGDTFHFIINHNIRHFKQIENVQKAMQECKVIFR